MTMADHLDQQYRHLAELVQLLETERQLLVDSDVDGERLSLIANEKQGRLSDLERLEIQRLRAQQKLGYSDSTTDAERAARDHDCLAHWTRLRREVRRAAHLNQLNGELIHLRMTTNQRMLNALQKVVDTSLYGPNGHTFGISGKLSSSA